VQSVSLATGLGMLGTFEGSVVRLLARKLRRISKELTATNQKVGSSNLSGRTTSPSQLFDGFKVRCKISTLCCAKRGAPGVSFGPAF
jgi:hypothetical protein